MFTVRCGPIYILLLIYSMENVVDVLVYNDSFVMQPYISYCSGFRVKHPIDVN